jgi:4-amino-4-deoxy-L-arabinose transferase-like glycosyltransferase
LSSTRQRPGATIRRRFGPLAAIIAGTVLALIPVATLMFRFDHPDALLVLVMALAAYATTRAIESGRTWWLALAGALLGLGYLTKMLQAFGRRFLRGERVQNPPMANRCGTRSK